MAISVNTKKLLLRIVLFLVYLLLGATIFHFVENDHEQKQRLSNDFQKNAYRNFTTKYNISDEEMRLFFTELKVAMKYGFDLDLNAYPRSAQWGFMNAFHFAGNVVTTIGYGHLAPLTVLGRFLCIFYALFGIPLTGLTLRSIGNRISEGLGTLIKMFDRRVYNRESEKLEIKTAMLAFGILLVIIFGPAVGFHYLEGWAYTDAVYFCFVTLTTIGFGDFVPGKTKQKLTDEDALVATLEFLNLIYMVVGLAVMSGVIVSISGVIEEKTKNFGVDPMEALRNIRVENLNSRALKKLGYKMGSTEDNRPQRPPPKRPMGVPVGSTNNMRSNVNSDGRSRSAETMDFQGPTPVLHLNKQTNGTTSDTKSPAGSPPGKKMFNNKISPANHTDSRGDANNGVASSKSDDSLRRGSEHTSTSTEAAEEARSSDEDNNVKRGQELEYGVNHADVNRSSIVESLQAPTKRDSKNELVVEVQLTPLPSPRASPIPVPLQSRRSDPDIGYIETYEESVKGSIDSTFTRDKMEGIGTGRNDPYPKDTVLTMDESNEMTPVDINHSGTANGFLSKGDSLSSRRGKLKHAEHIDLGDKSVSRIER